MYARGVEHTRASQPASETELTDAEKKEVAELKARDAEVRRHEQAHLTAAGPHGKGAPHFEYEKGPDGKRYVVDGHVEIDAAEVRGNPEATLKKARIVRRAALAPAEPSAQDQKVAREAETMARKAERELQDLKAEEANPSGPPAQGYDRFGSQAFGFSTPALINVVA